MTLNGDIRNKSLPNASCDDELEVVLENVEEAKQQQLKSQAVADEENNIDDEIVGEQYDSINNDDDDDDPRRKHWKESDFAVGLVDITWKDSRQEGCCCLCCCSSEADRNLQEDSIDLARTSCSSYLCVKAGRVGNMVVLEEGTTRDGKRRLDIIMGPFWPFPIMITFPIIIGVSLLTIFRSILDELHVAVQVVWAVLTVSLLISLSCVSCRNPGILYRHRTIPTHDWVWNDQALTYRPPRAKYDGDCGVVIENFDHTCPWTGTGIGKNNMTAFQCFCVLVLVCLVFDIVLLTGGPMVGG